MSGTTTPQVMQAQQPLGGGQLSALGASMLGPAQMGMGALPNPMQSMSPLMSMIMMQKMQQQQADQSGAGSNSMMGATPMPGVPGPPSALMNALPSWLSGNQTTSAYN